MAVSEPKGRSIETPPTFLTVREVAQLLRLKERRIYALAQSGALPSRRVTGRLLFARTEVEAWLAAGAAAVLSPAPAEAPASILVGSHDPLLEWSLRESRSGLASFFDGSLDGLARLAQGEAAGAALHLPEAGATRWNVGHVRARLGERPVVLLEWAWRERGLLLPAGNPLGIGSLADAAGRRLAARQPEAGTQLLLEQLLRQASIDPAGQPASPFVARSETDAALAVAEGKVDAAFGLRCLALPYRLEFLPVTRERFDLCLDRRAFFEPAFQRLLTFCRSDAFRRRAAEMGGYDVSGLMTVHFNGP